MSLPRASATLLACLICGICLAGCGDRASIVAGGTVKGDTLTVVSLMPEPDKGAARDIVDGERLALADAGGRAGAYSVNFRSIDETDGAVGDELPGEAAESARAALSDGQAIAVIGDLGDDAARVSVPLLNAAGVLHVSPGATYAGFTDPVSPGEPARFQPAGAPTLARIVPGDVEQAQALVRAARAAGGVRARVLVEGDAGPSNEALVERARAIVLDDGQLRGAERPDRADVAIYVGDDPVSARGEIEGLLDEAPRLRVIGSDGLARAGLLEDLPASVAGRVRLVSTARPDEHPTAAQSAFADRFRSRLGRGPGPYASLGYEAMAAVLAAVRRSGPAANVRATVRDRFFATDGLGLLDGTALSIRPNGDAAGPGFSLQRRTAGGAVVNGALP